MLKGKQPTPDSSRGTVASWVRSEKPARTTGGAATDPDGDIAGISGNESLPRKEK